MAKAAEAKEPKQARLPGVEDPEIQELESAAEEYADTRDKRMRLTERESDQKESLLALMKKHKKVKYIHGHIEIRVVAEEETVKVKIKKDDD